LDVGKSLISYPTLFLTQPSSERSRGLDTKLSSKSLLTDIGLQEFVAAETLRYTSLKCVRLFKVPALHYHSVKGGCYDHQTDMGDGLLGVYAHNMEEDLFLQDTV
jgi:hypothetical protein